MIVYFCLFQLNRDSILTLPTLKESVFQNYEKLAGPLREDFEEGQIERIFKVTEVVSVKILFIKFLRKNDFITLFLYFNLIGLCIYQVLCDMPTLEIDLYVMGQLKDENDLLQRVKLPSTKDDWIQIHQNQVTFESFHFIFFSLPSL